jgi:YYY domain-containing protein
MEVGLVLLWIGAFLLLGAITLPFSAWLLPDANSVAFSIPIALAVLGVVGHLVGHFAFGWPALVAGLLVLAGLSVGSVRHNEFDIEPARLIEIGAVFSVGFLLVVFIRGIDPAAAPLPISSGEKFLDFGLLNTLERSSSLPPESMWFAGESMQYYYGGHLVSALLGTLTLTDTGYAYNLSLAGFFGTLLVTAYGLAASIARPYDVSRRVAGVLGAFFVGVAGNLDTAVRLVTWLLPDGVAKTLATRLGRDPAATDWSPSAFDYWDASRVVPVDPGNPESNFLAATEFPLFSWLNGDLHAHMMSQPFMLLVAALLLAAWRAPVSHRRLLLFVFLPPLVGLIGFINLWSLPTALGLTTLAVAFSPSHPADMLPDRVRDATASPGSEIPYSEEFSRLLIGPLVAGVVGLLGIVWTLPFWVTVVLDSPSKSIEYWSQSTPLGPFAVVFGAFIVAIAAYLARAIWTTTERVPPVAVLALGGFVVTLSMVAGLPVVGLTLPLILVGWWLLRQETVGFEVVLVVAGAGIVFLVEFVTVAGERFNVIFKPYAHVWLFWAIASAVALARLGAGWPAGEETDGDGLVEANKTRLRRTGTVLAVVLVLVTVPYAPLALANHAESGTETTDELGTTLDGTAYLEVEYPEEAPGIRWLADRSGQPTILTSAPAGYYWRPFEGKGSAAPSSITGIPTVAGWSHEAQYRGRTVYYDRVRDVRTMYGGNASQQRELLATYDVEYIYVGPAERNADEFDVTVDTLDALSVAHSSEDVTIYEVDQDELDGER